jgi:hypothetical protein
MVNERVLATLCFWAALARPATLLEIHQWLVSSSTQTHSVSLGQVQIALDELVLAGVVHAQSGLYLLASCPLEWCERRIEQEKETVQKYRKLLPALWVKMRLLILKLYNDGMCFFVKNCWFVVLMVLCVQLQ